MATSMWDVYFSSNPLSLFYFLVFFLYLFYYWWVLLCRDRLICIVGFVWLNCFYFWSVSFSTSRSTFSVHLFFLFIFFPLASWMTFYFARKSCFSVFILFSNLKKFLKNYSKSFIDFVSFHFNSIICNAFAILL